MESDRDEEFRAKAISVLRRLLRMDFQIVIPAEIAEEVRVMEIRTGPPQTESPDARAMAARRYRERVAEKKKKMAEEKA